MSPSIARYLLPSANSKVKHRAIGKGEVKGIDGSVMVVVFNGVDKNFNFRVPLNKDSLN